MSGYPRHPRIAPALILGCSLAACTASAFTPLPDGPVNAVAIVPGPPEQYFVGGGFERIGNMDTGPLALLNADGTVDTSFQVTFSGVSPTVQTLHRQGNGLLLVGGSFTHVNGHERPAFARLHPDGDLDLNFQPSLGSGAITCIEQPPMYVIVGIGWAVQLLDVENGNVLATYDAGGPVQTIDAWDDEGTRLYIGGQFPEGVRLLKRIGTVLEEDPNFNFDGNGFYQILPGADPRVYVADAVRGGTVILVGGRFDGYEEMRLGWAWPLDWPRANIAMIYPNGNFHNGFLPSNEGPDGDVRAVYELPSPDTDYLVVGAFTTYGGASVNGIARIEADGTVVPEFNEGGSGFNAPFPKGIVPVADGRLLVYGGFTSYNGSFFARYLVRIDETGALDDESPFPRPPGTLGLPVSDTVIPLGSPHTLAIPDDIFVRGFPAPDAGQVVWRHDGVEFDPAPDRWQHHDPAMTIGDYGVYEVEMWNDLGTGTVSFVVQEPASPQFSVYEPGLFTSAWEAGTYAEVIWGPAVEDPTDIDLSLDGGTSWSPVGTALEDTGRFAFFFDEPFGYYRFLVPEVEAPDARVRVHRTGTTEGAGESGPVAIATLEHTPSETWRQDHFGITTNTGLAADGENPDRDPIVNIFEFLFGTDPNDAESWDLPRIEMLDDGPHITFPWHAQASDIIVDIVTGGDVHGDTVIWDSRRDPWQSMNRIAFPANLADKGFGTVRATRPDSD